VRVTLSGIIAVLLAASCWAMSGIFVKLIMAGTGLSSLTLAYWRDTVSFLAFLAWGLATQCNRMTIRKEDWSILAGMGISLGIFHVALNLGYRLNGAAITTVQQAAMPAIVLIVARMVWKEPLTGFKIFSLALIALGTVLISGILEVGAPDVSVASIAVGFIVPALYAAWSLFGKALRRGYSPVATLAWAFGIAAVVLLPCQAFTGSLLPPSVQLRFYLWFGGLTGISTVFAFFSYTFALGHLPAGIASILVMSEIAFAVIYARIFLGEVLASIEILGAGVVIGGVLFLLAPEAMLGKKRRTAKPSRSPDTESQNAALEDIGTKCDSRRM
jgi:drug/metabolite transporter, DME family